MSFSSLPAFDHIAVCAPNIEDAVKNFQSLGFNVAVGGGNGPLQSALIPFENGAYLELSAASWPSLRTAMRAANALGVLPFLLSNKRSGVRRRFAPWVCAERGIIDWAVMVDGIGDVIERARAEGIECYDPGPFRRVAPGREEPTWQLASAVSHELPFLIEDDEGSAPRFPSSFSPTHANGASGFDRLVVAVKEPEHYDQDLKRYLGRSDLVTKIDVVKATDKTVGVIRIDITADVQEPQQLDPDLTFGADIYLTPPKNGSAISG